MNAMKDELQLSGFQMANRDFLSREYARSMGWKSRTAKRHDVPHKEAMKLYNRGLTDINIAAMLGVSKGDVYKWRQANGLISNMIRQREQRTRSRRTKKPTKSDE